MAQRLHLSLLLTFGLAIIAGLFLISPTRAAGDPVSLICPNKQTTFLSGNGAPPGESLIAYLSTRPVGGGSARVDGSWRIPLFVNERPGVYPVEVKVRGTRTLIASFTCFVDVPVEAATSSAESGGGAPVSTTATLTAIPSPERGSGSPTRTPTPLRTATTPTPIVTPSPTTAPTSATSSRATATTAPTVTGQTGAKVKISDVFCRDPQYPADSEYIELRNDDTVTVDLQGWKIINASRSNITYTFPSYTMDRGPDFYVTVYSGIGTDRPDFDEFYWNRTDQLWFVGDRAELRDPAGNLIDAYDVSQSNCN